MLKHEAAYLDNLNGYIELKVENNNIYWRQISTTEGEWKTLVSLSSLSGYDTTKAQSVEVAVNIIILNL